MNATEIKEDTSTELDQGNDDNRLTHIVRNSDQARGYVMGDPIVAICGKKWIPYRDPELFPLCKKCDEIYESVFGFKFSH